MTARDEGYRKGNTRSNLKRAAVWDIASCSLEEADRRFIAAAV
jgi:hypothetical protein